MLTKVKKKVQSWILFEAKLAFEAGLAPSQISALGILFAVVSGFSYWLAGPLSPIASIRQTFMVLAPVFLLISGFCDALDGALARLYGETTTFGGFLDSLLDRYADSSIYLGLAVGGLCDTSWGIIALVGSLLVSYARARSEAAGVKMETVGIAERAERILMIVFGSFAALIWPDVLRWSIILLALLTNFTVLQRTAYFHKKTRS